MRIYLTEGFTGEPVRITVNGSPVFDRPDVRTNWSVGLAATAVTDAVGQVSVGVEVPGRGLRAEHTMAASEERALLVALQPVGIGFKEEQEPVRFL